MTIHVYFYFLFNITLPVSFAVDSHTQSLNQVLTSPNTPCCTANTVSSTNPLSVKKSEQ